MAYQTTVLPSFGSIRMDVSEGLMKPDMSPDACNSLAGCSPWGC